MSDVEYILGSQELISQPLQPFDDQCCAFLNDVSVSLFNSSYIREFPDLSAFAFWGRKAKINSLKSNYDDLSMRIGRGLCFHVAPSNIPINFAFSYAFSLLSGNANIVRVPSKELSQVDILCEVLKENMTKYPEIECRTAFVKYPRGSNATKDFSQIADCRMIWGGDDTISVIRKMDTKPKCMDISFADRYSLTLINGDEINNANAAEIERLSQFFYNDTYLMDQNACSSPQLICWINDNATARKKFWNGVYRYADANYRLQDAIAIDKYTKLCEDSVRFEFIKSTTLKTNLLYRSELTKLTPQIDAIRGTGGYFYEYALGAPNELFDVINEKYQTITYFGIDPEELRNELIHNRAKGIDRIVPIGRALDIDILWDGHDLIRELSRLCTIS